MMCRRLSSSVVMSPGGEDNQHCCFLRQPLPDGASLKIRLYFRKGFDGVK